MTRIRYAFLALFLAITATHLDATTSFDPDPDPPECGDPTMGSGC